MSDTAEIARLLREAEVPERKIPDLGEQIFRWRGKPQDLVARVHLESDQITIGVDVSTVVELPDCILQLMVPVGFRRRGIQKRLILTEEPSALHDPRVDAALLKAIVRARVWFDDLANSRVASLEEVGRRERISDRYVGSLMSLAFLAPDIVAGVVDGTQPMTLTTQELVMRTNLPIAWDHQRTLIDP